MNKSSLIGAIVIAVSIIIAAALHAQMTVSNYQIAIGNNLTSTALVSTKTGKVWLMADKEDARTFKRVFQGWYRVPDMEVSMEKINHRKGLYGNH